jgi:hypothetical protein
MSIYGAFPTASTFFCFIGGAAEATEGIWKIIGRIFSQVIELGSALPVV